MLGEEQSFTIVLVLKHDCSSKSPQELFKLNIIFKLNLIPGPHLQRSLHWSGVGPKPVQVIPIEVEVEHPCRTAMYHLAEEPRLPCNERGRGTPLQASLLLLPRPSCLSSAIPPPAVHPQASLGHASLVRPWAWDGAVQKLSDKILFTWTSQQRKKIEKKASSYVEKYRNTLNAHRALIEVPYILTRKSLGKD